MIRPLPIEQIKDLVRRALREDVGNGDVTTESISQENPVAEAEITAKEPLVLCGTDFFRAVFAHLDPESMFPERNFKDGDRVDAGTVFLSVKAKTKALLIGERTALNGLQRFSGIATLTRKFVNQAGPVTILDTRKTTPGLRLFEKYAVQCGGGTNHRIGLFDGVLIKDNHIKAAGSISNAVSRVRSLHGSEFPIEVESANLDEVEEALSAGADIILLDNMSTAAIREAARLISGKAKVEVSGSITLERLPELAEAGIDMVSVGALTHSAPSVDISMNFL